MVGARSAAAKCELRPARAGGGVKSGSGGGEGQDGGGGPSWWLVPSPRTPGLAAGARSLSLHRFLLSLLRSCSALPRLLPAEERRGGRAPPPTLPVPPPLAPRSPPRAGPRNCRRGRRSVFPPAARAECWGGEGVSAASRPGVGGRPPCPRLGPAPPSRGPFPAQGRAAAAGRAPRGGRAGVFNGSMLPAAGAAPGQAGPPARPQPPRSHQLQLQLRALRMPQSPATLTGTRRRRHGPALGGFSLLFPSSHPGSPPRHPQSRLFTSDPALFIVWGFLGWPLDSRAFSFILGLCTLSPSASSESRPARGLWEPSDLRQARPLRARRAKLRDGLFSSLRGRAPRTLIVASGTPVPPPPGTHLCGVCASPPRGVRMVLRSPGR